MNDVGRSFFLLQCSDLDARSIQDYKLRTDGDLSRYQDLPDLMRRFVTTHDEQARQSTIPEMVRQFYGEPPWSSDYWQENDDGWHDGNDDPEVQTDLHGDPVSKVGQHV